ncbi:MAG: phosphoribosylaminoimidazolesuccinocarboxamide synthase [Firmicutes bacterium]|nr:phosphoribosylaminoimidazolesuccinocarboxamide synthase [Bacillota bacterium]MBQ9604495.1 phosphoribosylaminoimidazolesuccinocarboxamide synthase [Bacillota bacterium]
MAAKKELMYEGKAKRVYSTDDPNLCIFEYKDDATAFNGIKKGSFEGKGEINNQMANFIFRLLEEKGIKTHMVEELSKRETLVKKVDIIPLEVIVRNIAAGSFSKRYGVEEGTPFKEPTLEFSYKNDELGDPLINDYHALALGIATREDIKTIANIAFSVNDALKEIFKNIGIKLVDFKIEVGRTAEGEIVLADEISPDTCRLWDAETNKKLDKDQFRRDLGEFAEVYHEVWARLNDYYKK